MHYSYPAYYSRKIYPETIAAVRCRVINKYVFAQLFRKIEVPLPDTVLLLSKLLLEESRRIPNSAFELESSLES